VNIISVKNKTHGRFSSCFKISNTNNIDVILRLNIVQSANVNARIYYTKPKNKQTIIVLKLAEYSNTFIGRPTHCFI